VRQRFVSLCLATTLAVMSGVAIAAAPATPAVAAAPACTFNGSALPIITDVAAGKTIAIRCTGLTPLRANLLFQASLLIGIDPQAKALLSGNSGVSPALFPAALAAIEKINPNSIKAVTTSATGTLSYNYKVPATASVDPNATCPPSTRQFNAGLLGCALAMVDVITQKPVGAASAVMEFSGFPLLPPAPTLTAWAPNYSLKPGQAAGISDTPGHTTFWWAPTLGALNSLLSGDTTGQKIAVTVSQPGIKKVAASAATVTASASTKPTFTPGKLGGFFVMPKGMPKGLKLVTVTLTQPLLGIPIANVGITLVNQI
jgi:hypothetical protein